MGESKVRTTTVEPIATGERRRGRPIGSTTIDEPRVSASVWLPVSMFDKIHRLATEHELSISATMRRLLVLRLK